MTLNQFLFKNRSYTPLPFLLVMAIFAHPTLESMVAGFILVLIGEFLRSWGVFYVGSETRVTHQVGASKLVTTGAFSHTRNPLYVGNITIYTGVGIMSNALFPWLPLAGLFYFIFQYMLIVLEEEKYLRSQFGKEYAEYVRNVPRFFFRISSYKSNSSYTINWKAGWQSETRTLQAIVVIVAILSAIWIFR